MLRVRFTKIHCGVADEEKAASKKEAGSSGGKSNVKRD